MSTQPPPSEFDLEKELRELGEQIKRAFEVTRAHPKTKEFEQQVVKAMNDLEAEIRHAIQSAQTHEPVKKAGAQVMQAAQALKDSGAPDDIARGIAKGVRALNEQIRKAIEDAEKK